MENIDKLRYPIGKFEHKGPITTSDIQQWISDIEQLPGQLREAVGKLTPDQLETTYRPGGWTVRQVIHHIGDSHLNSLIRFKWALTEDTPVIKSYHEDRWAELQDYKDVPVEVSLAFIENLHKRWVILLRSLTAEQLSRQFIHPESGSVSLDRNIGIYAWHGKHHLAHIATAIENN